MATVKEQVQVLVQEGLYRVEKDEDGKLWGLFTSQDPYDSYQKLDLQSGTEMDNAMEEQGLMTVMPNAAGSVGFGV